MAIEQPAGTSKRNSPSHSLLHRIIAADASASTYSIGVDSSSNVAITATKKLYLDGASGAGSNTYITESAADTVDLYAGGVNTIRSVAATTSVPVDLTVGTSTSVAIRGTARRFQIFGTNEGRSGMSITRGSVNTAAPTLTFVKSRSATYGTTFTIVNDNDILGQVWFGGSDGVDYATMGAKIEALVDGTPAENKIPSELIFSTSETSAGTMTPALRIDSSQIVDFVGTMANSTQDPTTQSPTDWLQIKIADTDYYVPCYNSST